MARDLMPRARRAADCSYMRCVILATSSDVGLVGNEESDVVSLLAVESAYALHSSRRARSLICARAMARASLGATTALKHEPSSGSLSTRREAPTSVQTIGAPVKAASPRARGRPSEIEEFRNSHCIAASASLLCKGKEAGYLQSSGER